MSPRRIVAASALVALGLIVVGGYRFARRMAEPASYGVTIGMTPSAVRDSFRPGTRGRFAPWPIPRGAAEAELTWEAIVVAEQRPVRARFHFDRGRLDRFDVDYPERR